MKQKKNKYAGKFVVAYDTMCEGNKCTMTEENGKEVPVLYDSYEEAFKEMFDDNLSMLEGRSASELREYNEGVTKKLVKEMRKVYDSGDVKAMEKFWNEHPDVNDGGDWVEKAEEFTMNRKAIFTGEGVVITGAKLK